MTNHWAAAVIALISVLVGVLASYLIGLHFEFADFVGPLPEAQQPTWAEAFSFAGIIVTVMAFVAAFFILFTALDSFAVSKETTRVRSLVNENRLLTRQQEEAAKKLEGKLKQIENVSSSVQAQLWIFEMMVEEFGSFNVDFTTTMNAQIDYLAEAQSASSEVQKLRGSMQTQMRGMARMDALASVSSDGKNLERLERGRIAYAELLPLAREGELQDQLILLMLHHRRVVVLEESDYGNFLEAAPLSFRQLLEVETPKP